MFVHHCATARSLHLSPECSTLMAGAGKEKMLISTELYNRLNPFASPAPPTA
jgi:hypothetical protein